MSNLIPRRNYFPEDSFFDQVFNSFYDQRAGRPNVDIRETEHAFEVSADLPGMNKEDIEVSFKNNVLSIGAERSDEKNISNEEGTYIRRERTSSSFKRQFIVEGVETAQIKAGYENGVLTITLPKVDQEALEAESKIDIE